MRFPARVEHMIGMTRAMAKLLKAPSQAEFITADMNFPYCVFWTGAHGTYRGMRPLEPQWVHMLIDKPGSKAVSFDSDHWPMVRQPQAFNLAVLQWLAQP